MNNKNIVEGSSNSTFNLRTQYVDPLEESKNYSGNDLDIKNPWRHFDGKSARYCLEHRNDRIGNLGFDYRGNILKRSLSGVLFLENKRKSILEDLEY